MAEPFKAVEYRGVKWSDIDWPDMPTCDECGGDAAEGHLNACPYLYASQESPAGEAWVVNKIKYAIERGWLRNG